MDIKQLKDLWDLAQAAPPPRLEHYQKLTEELVKTWRSGDPDALAQIKSRHPRLRKLPDAETRSAEFELMDAQFIVAQSLGFASWPEFVEHVDDRIADQNYLLFPYAVEALHAGNFSRIEALFDKQKFGDRSRCRIVEWYDEGCFDDQPKALAEALTCACMLGKTDVAEFLLDKGVDPAEGVNTGLNGFHYAASSGHLDTIKLLIERQAPLEVKNMYGGTVLDQAVWSAINESQVDHLSIIEALIDAGAKVDAVAYPTGHERIDEMLKRHGAKPREKAANDPDASS